MLESFPNLTFTIYMQKTYKISQNFKLAIIMESTENRFIYCGVIS